MTEIDQSLVASGFDVEALVSGRYLQILIQTMYDADVIPREREFGGTKVRLIGLDDGDKLYESAPEPDGSLPFTMDQAFETEILFGHSLGANLRVQLMVEPSVGLPFPFDLFIQVGLVKERDDEGTLSNVGLTIHVVDIDSPVLAVLAEPPHSIPKADVLAQAQQFVDRTIDMAGASKLKKVEDLDIRWHEPHAAHPAALGVYVNVRLRNGDEEDQFLPARGSVADAVNFLPDGEDLAMASRPGLYRDMSKDVFSRTAIRNAAGGMEHALRYNILNPKSKRIGDVDSIRVGQVMLAPGAPDNGLRITLEGEYIDPIDATNTDVTFTIDIRPLIDSDGLLVWDTRLDVDVDALFEFITLWAFTLIAITLGPIGAGIFLGVVLIGQIGAGIFLGEHFEARAAKKADAALSDVIPDRLTVKTRRWDPFYATKHQVVIKPSQAEFNAAGVLLCGKAFVGRELVPPVDTVIRDETRDAAGVISGLRYRIADFETVRDDITRHAPGMSRRDFTDADAADPDLFGLTLEQIQERMDDAEGPLVVTRIPYFVAAVHVVEHQLDHLLCISATELGAFLDELRDRVAARRYDEIVANEGDAIRQDVIDDLSAGGATPSQQEIDDELDKRVRTKVKAIMDNWDPPTPLELAKTGALHHLLRFDVAPEELLMLQDKKVVVIDNELDSVEPRGAQRYLRDHQDPPGPDADRDNLLTRPRYRPTPAGPDFQ